MILDFNKMSVTKIDNFKGGEKEIFSKMFVDENNKIMLSVLRPGASIGYHTHDSSSETIFIIRGRGLANIDGEEFFVSEGQALYCPIHHSHSLKNNTDEELMFFAVVPEHKN